MLGPLGCTRMTRWALSVTVVGACLAVLGAGPAAAGASFARPSCGGFYAHRSAPAGLALDARPGAPRVFAIQYKQDAHSVVSYTSFRTKIECLLRRYVLPHLARLRPNVVVFNEDVGLATFATGSRGAAARRLFGPSPACQAAGAHCGVLDALGLLTAAYSGPLAAYHQLFPGLGGLDEGFVAATDTIVRSFMGSFSTLARRYHVYMVGSADVAPFHQSRAAADLARFADPDLHPGPASVYVATSPDVYNEVLMWGPRDVRRSGPDVLRNAVAVNRKVPLTPLETYLQLTPGPAHGPAAVANLRPYRLPGTRARIGFATSLPAFVYGSPPPGVDPCSDTSLYYMRCLDRLGANLVIQDEANPGAWTGPDGNGLELWQPLSWMTSTYRTASDPSVHFAYNVTAMMVGNLADLVFDGQSAITQRDLGRGLPAGRVRRCHYIGNGSFVPGEDQRALRPYVGAKPDFLALAPWVVGDRSRAGLRHVGAELAPRSGSGLEDDYLETALVADLPFPVDSRRTGCVA